MSSTAKPTTITISSSRKESRDDLLQPLPGFLSLLKRRHCRYGSRSPKVIFQIGLKANATSLILSHNHPSGNKEPSESDKALTKKLVDAGKVLEIHVLDHVILTSTAYFSFADEGILPSG